MCKPPWIAPTVCDALICHDSFHSFFTHVDNYRTPIFLYLSSKGLEACGDVRSEPATKRDMSRKERGVFSKRKERNRESREAAMAGTAAGTAD